MGVKTRSKSSARWLKEHHGDAFVRDARDAGFRSRAAFKLEHIQKSDKLLRPGMTVVDLGAAPGGWSQVAVGQVGPSGRVVAFDLLEMESIAGVEVLRGDFSKDSGLDQLNGLLHDSQVDLVLSDMAPNMSGIRAVDQARAMELAELCLDFVREVCRPGASALIKVFEGAGLSEFRVDLRRSFGRVQTRKPEASRARSRELYLLARNYTV
jgi:23S rRNA (uridine2552-2'-O)-methyltransferase